MKKIIAYKGFDKDLKCRGFQYEVGKTYEIKDKPVRCTDHGFHSCYNPLDVFGYYSPGESRFALIEASGKIDNGDGDSKFASQSITIKAEITLNDYIKAAFDFVWNAADKKKSNHVKGDQSASSATGYRSASSATGYQSASSATGDQSASSATGDQSASSATGYRSASSATGYRSASSATGDQSASMTTGHHSKSSIEGKSEKSIAAAFGYENQAKAPHGNWIVLAERDYELNILNIKSAQAGITKGVKADTWYVLKNGKFKEAA